MHTLLTIETLSLTIRKKTILNKVCLTLCRGECLAIVGASGSGKSSLALTILGLFQPTHGHITFVTSTHKPKAKAVQMIWQDVSSSLNPAMTVKDLILEPLKIIGEECPQEKICHILHLVNLPSSFLHLKPHKLSGGQKQRVAIARALICEPELIICDEPLSSLDTRNQSLILDLFRTIKHHCSSTLLFITHDMSAAYYLADKIAVMEQGTIVETERTETIFSSPHHPATQQLLNAIPKFFLKDTKNHRSAIKKEGIFV